MDREVSVHTTHTSKSQSQGESYISHKKNTKSMQLKIDRLHRKLCRERQRRTPPYSDPSSEDDRDGSYRPRSRTPLSESFSRDKDHCHRCRSKSSSRKGLGNDAIALNQISKSPFTRRIEAR